ncbi:hypothetical protein SK128_007343 [Halocaridina rubra]|uniref:Uncharacterized protein n=1 Tax=Halocaridina rubra TaxID=373956 RepID=A0AAN8WMW4_HALRR
MRHVGRMDSINADTFTLYDGDWFTGDQYYGELDQSVLNSFNNLATSVIVTGQSSWTFYAQHDYGGKSFCLPPVNGTSGNEIQLGYSVNLDDNGWNNTISSVRKGCFSDFVIGETKYELLSEIRTFSEHLYS